MSLTFLCPSYVTTKRLYKAAHRNNCADSWANIDLYLEYQTARKGLQITNTWIKEHQNKDLKWSNHDKLHKLDLPIEAKLNILCDQHAGEAQHLFSSSIDIEIYPHERYHCMLVP
jgi:hypothetical protein